MKHETAGHIHELKDGIMHLYVKPGVPNVEDIQESMDYMKSLNQKLLIFCDPTDATALSKEQRKFVAEEFNTFVTAFAMKETNFISHLVFNLVIKFNKPQFAFKLVKSEEDGLKWLRTFK